MEDIISGFYSWVRTILLVGVLASFLDLLAPEGEMRKYIRLFVGLVMLVVIMRPVWEMLGAGINFPDSNVGFSVNKLPANVVQNVQAIQLTNEELTARLVERAVANNAASKLQGKLQNPKVTATVSLNTGRKIDLIKVSILNREPVSPETLALLAQQLATEYGVEGSQVRVDQQPTGHQEGR